jgi:hypothetical protein
MQITINKIEHSGALELSTITFNRLVRRVYYGFSQTEAKRNFRIYLKTLSN